MPLFPSIFGLLCTVRGVLPTANFSSYQPLCWMLCSSLREPHFQRYGRCLALSALADSTLDGALAVDLPTACIDDGVLSDRYDSLHQSIQLFTLALRALDRDVPEIGRHIVSGGVRSSDAVRDRVRTYLFIRRAIAYFNAAMYSLAEGDCCDGVMGGVELPLSLMVSSQLLMTAVALVSRRTGLSGALQRLLGAQRPGAASFMSLFGEGADATACDALLELAAGTEEARTVGSERTADSLHLCFPAHCPSEAELADTFELLVEDDPSLMQVCSGPVGRDITAVALHKRSHQLPLQTGSQTKQHLAVGRRAVVAMLPRGPCDARRGPLQS